MQQQTPDEFEGLLFLRERDGLWQLIPAEQLEDLSEAERRLLSAFKRKLAAAAPKCRSQRNPNNRSELRCRRQGCAHPCHIFRAQLPIPSDEEPEFEDMGENNGSDWYETERGYGYVCGCDAWDN